MQGWVQSVVVFSWGGLLFLCKGSLFIVVIQDGIVNNFVFIFVEIVEVFYFVCVWFRFVVWVFVDGNVFVGWGIFIGIVV